MPSVETRTVLVTDLVDSTALRVETGDAEADRVRRSHVELVESAVSARGGTVVKGTGDGTLALFAAAAEAIGAAISIQQQSVARRTSERAPSVRVGLAAGDVTLEDDDCFGRPVIEACRLEAEAEPDAILATKLVELLAAGRTEARFLDRGMAELKGFPDPVAVAEVQFDIPQADDRAPDLPVAITATRLSPPGLPRHVVARPRIDARLGSALKHRIVPVEAGAGYGKSTAAAGYLLDSEAPWCWISCDRGLVQPVVLAAHVCAAIGSLYPGFGLDAWPEEPDELAAAFADEAARSVVEELVVCVDDVHALAESTRATLLGMVERTPPPTRWLLLSREPVRLSARVALDAAPPIAEADLAFEAGEARELIQTLVPGGDAGLAQRIQDEAEGWAAGLILSARGSGRAGPGHAGASFDYLAEEALGTLPGHVVDFVERVSLPSRFSADLARALTGRDDAGAVIGQLVDGHLFTIPLDAEGVWFRFHHLFRAFLRSRLLGRGEAELAALNHALADAWVAAGEPAEAVRSFVAAGDQESAAAKLGPLFPTALVGGRHAALRPLLESIEPEVRHQHADLLVAEAVGHLYDGKHEQAYAEYERSIGLLFDRGERQSAAGVLLRYLQDMLTGGTVLEERIDVAERVLPGVRGAGPDAAAAQILAAIGYGHATRTDEAERLIDEALAWDASGAVGALASVVRGYCVDFPRGDIDAGLAGMEAAIAFGLAAGDDDAYSSAGMGMGLRAAVLPQIGRYEDAMVQADDAIAEVTRIWGSPVSLERAVRWWRLSATVGMEDWSAADVYAGDPSEVLSGPADLWSHRLAAPYARLAASRGDEDQAIRLIRHGTEAIAGMGRTMDAPMVLCEFAHAAADVGLSELRGRLARDALAYADECGLAYRAAHAAMHCADCATGEERDGFLAQALTLTRERGYEFLWARHERRLAARLLARGLELDDWRAFAAELAGLAGREVARSCAGAVAGRSPEGAAVLRQALLRGADPDPEAISLVAAGGLDAPEVIDAIIARPRAALALRGFGGLAVARGGDPVPADALGEGSVAPAILARLLASWPEDVPVAELLERHWPDRSRPESEQALEVAVDRLALALDPWAPQRGASPVLVRGGGLGLRLGARDRIDLAPLRAPERWADMSLSRLREVERETAGTFLPEHASEDWAAAVALALGAARTDFLLVLAERLREGGQPGAGADRLRALVERDPEREELHRRLMRCYVEAGESARALRQYHACRSVLLRHHGIEPSAETRALFEALV